VSEIQVILFFVEALRYRMAEARLEPERGDVARRSSSWASSWRWRSRSAR